MSMLIEIQRVFHLLNVVVSALVTAYVRSCTGIGVRRFLRRMF